MKYTNSMGISVPDEGWVPAPRYILRRNIVLKLLKKYPQGTVAEIGCGSGAFLYDLAERGFKGYGVDFSKQAIVLSKKILTSKRAIKVKSKIVPEMFGKIKYFFAFEVLEHIEDDIAALKDWRSMLCPDGILFLSVPARMKKWDERDVWAGHYRRYEREDIESVCDKAGLSLIKIYSYGWPLANILKPFIKKTYRKKNITEAERSAASSQVKQKNRTSRSGIDRSAEVKAFRLYDNIFGVIIFKVLAFIQLFVFSTNLGDGYIFVARSKCLSKNK